jgi:hypothetical protein|tara:strand:+ start:236 stop:487 length:252 start_codon:yes stop_codon:yes gene_type:complete
MFFLSRINKIARYTTIGFTIFGFLLSLFYSLVSFIFICPTSNACPSNPLPAILLIFIVTTFFSIFGLFFGMILIKLYDLFKVE